MPRPDWEEYFMAIAHAVALRSSCPRKRVGAVLFDSDMRLRGSGYNGAPSGEAHCDEAGHDMEDGHCTRAVHAEANAILSCASAGVATQGLGLAVTVFPCWSCLKLIRQAGISYVVYDEIYGDPARVLEACERWGISIKQGKASIIPAGSIEGSPGKGLEILRRGLEELHE
jgi:dCMP deaminase